MPRQLRSLIRWALTAVLIVPLSACLDMKAGATFDASGAADISLTLDLGRLNAALKGTASCARLLEGDDQGWACDSLQPGVLQLSRHLSREQSQPYLTIEDEFLQRTYRLDLAALAQSIGLKRKADPGLAARMDAQGIKQLKALGVQYVFDVALPGQPRVRVDMLDLTVWQPGSRIESREGRTGLIFGLGGLALLLVGGGFWFARQAQYDRTVRLVILVLGVVLGAVTAASPWWVPALSPSRSGLSQQTARG